MNNKLKCGSQRIDEDYFTYERLQICHSSDENHLINKELLKIAEWHNLTPMLWNPNYKVNDAILKETIERIAKTNQDDLFITLARTYQNAICGFVWAYKQDKPENSAMIKSLYVDERYRNLGIATQLKVLLEKWCVEKGLNIIQTTVHFKNKKMINLNEKLGYEAGMVLMSKSL